MLDSNTKLSDHFTYGELTKSQTAVRKGIINTPNKECVDNLILLCNNILEPIRLHFDKPIVVSSGYRSPELNLLIGGSTTSDHCLGCAADIEIPGITTEDLYQGILKLNLPFDQCIQEFDKWVHVSHRPEINRLQRLRAIKENGKTKYTRE